MSMPPDWLFDYAESLGKKFSPFGWPEPGSEDSTDLVGDYWCAFDAAGVTQDEANRAARRLSLNPPERNRRLDYLPALMGVVRVMRAERAPQSGETMDRPQAEYASRDCQHCGGSGFALVWHPGFRQASPGKPHRFNCECVCPYGRLIRRGQMKANERYKGVDFADILRGTTDWRLWPPDLNPEPPAMDRGTVNEMFGTTTTTNAAF